MLLWNRCGFRMSPKGSYIRSLVLSVVRQEVMESLGGRPGGD